MGAEHHYLDAVEAFDSGDFDLAFKEAKAATTLDPKHVEAWVLYSDAALAGETKNPTLSQAAKSLNGCRKAIDLDPMLLQMWVRGGQLLSDNLGLLDDALQWWQDCRHHAPDEVSPIVEQATILTDMGLYSEADIRLTSIIEQNMDIATSQTGKLYYLMNLVKAAAEGTSGTYFRPWEKHHDGWGAISSKMRKPPVSETFIFMMATMPFLLLEVVLSDKIFGQGWGGFCLTSIIIFATVLFGMRLAKRWTGLLNKPAYNLLRAMNFEASTGYTVIDEEMRLSVLYLYIMQRKPKAWQERMIKIIDSGNKLPQGWKQQLPDFDSHLDEMGYIDEDYEDEQLEAYEEE